ncbi:CrcB family protein [Streptomyces sp. NPDC050703]|uniref:fluoride efflux transporter FluC n=1 Tax=Streptomyces sp. NPDC050703 TaxID=3157218 RepID=UPI00342265C3
MPTETGRPPAADEPVDPDIGSVGAERRRGPARGQAGTVAAVAVGGAVGASARYAAALLWPAAADAFPWWTLGVNAVGCALIGAFMVLITDVWSPHPLLRPFFGTGVLGGFTTFSTYATDIERLVSGGHVRAGLAYLALTLLAALLAVWGSAWTTRAIVAAVRA